MVPEPDFLSYPFEELNDKASSDKNSSLGLIILSRIDVCCVSCKSFSLWWHIGSSLMERYVDFLVVTSRREA